MINEQWKCQNQSGDERRLDCQHQHFLRAQREEIGYVIKARSRVIDFRDFQREQDEIKNLLVEHERENRDRKQRAHHLHQCFAQILKVFEKRFLVGVEACVGTGTFFSGAASFFPNFEEFFKSGF